MKVRDAVEKLMIAILAEGVKRETEKWYRVRFARFIKRYGDWEIEDTDIDVVRRYIVWLRDEEMSAQYFYSHVWVVRRLYKWLYEERWIDDPFWKRIRLPKLPQAVPKGVEIGDVKKMLSVCGEDKAGKRDRAAILFLLDTGCRAGGLCGLKISDVDFDRRSALLIEKGDRPRRVLFVEVTEAAIKDWLAIRPYKKSEFVFTSLREDVPLNPNSLIQMLRRRGEQAGVKGRVNPHAFRHAFAREYLRNGGDLASVSDLMGHSQIIVTKQSYAVFLTEEHRDKHDTFSPVSNLMVGS